ncbi:hypothetical protein [Salsipaludibacter albus]|uniref:hypothetical protein n=1 Tax=Salsipaludibacter albus TaxID=2849650 RepID=UPI001EE479A5|nr:hypothetical protein [Salsipaludibacter albus]MBY5162101.1 hypothetical protein [Salsipaludibacter albus]
MARRFGPVTIRSVTRAEDALAFEVLVGDRPVSVGVVTGSDAITARWLDAPGGEDDPASLPLTFRVDDDAHGLLTLPTQRSSSWVAAPVGGAAVRYYAGGPVRDWLASSGAELSTSCPIHAPQACASFPADKLGAAIVAVAATRVRPVLQDLEFDAALPWDLEPAGGSRSGTVFSGGDGEGTLVGELQLYDKLVDAVEEATRRAGPCIEYGIVEHAFAYANVDDYLFLYRRFGHIAVDHPLEFTLSGYLPRMLGNLWRRNELQFVPGPATGYWQYNGSISYWSLPKADTASTVSWRDFAEENDWHPMSWPAAALLWGEEPVIGPTWSGHLGPGEPPPGVTSETLPTSSRDERLPGFVRAFDTQAAFGADAAPIADRIQRNWEDGKGLPRDVGLLRDALGHADLDATTYVDALLDRIRQLV